MFCETPRLVSLEFEHLAQAVMEEFEISAPTSILEAVDLFLHLISVLD